MHKKLAEKMPLSFSHNTQNALQILNTILKLTPPHAMMLPSYTTLHPHNENNNSVC